MKLKAKEPEWMGTKNNPGAFDCYANAEPDEPMFVLLGRDKHAAVLVSLWAAMRELGGEDAAKVHEAKVCAAQMVGWLMARGKEPVRGDAVLRSIPMPPSVMLPANDEFVPVLLSLWVLMTEAKDGAGSASSEFRQLQALMEWRQSKGHTTNAGLVQLIPAIVEFARSAGVNLTILAQPELTGAEAAAAAGASLQ